MLRNLDKILEHIEKGLLAFSQGFTELASAASSARLHLDDSEKVDVKASTPKPISVGTPTFERSVVIPRNGFPREREKASFDFKTTIDYFDLVGKEYQVTGHSRGKRSNQVSRYRYEKVKIVATRTVRGSDPRKEVAAVLLTGPDFGTIVHFNRHELTLVGDQPITHTITDLKIAGLTYQGDMDEHPWIGHEVRLKEQDKSIPEIGTIIEAASNTAFKIELIDKSRNIQCLWLAPQFFTVLESQS